LTKDTHIEAIRGYTSKVSIRKMKKSVTVKEQILGIVQAIIL